MNHRTLTQRVYVLVEQGIFEDEESLKNTAYRSLLTLRPELKVEIALRYTKASRFPWGERLKLPAFLVRNSRRLWLHEGSNGRYPHFPKMRWRHRRGLPNPRIQRHNISAL